MALASMECAHEPWYTQLLDLNTPLAYHQTSLRLFSNFQEHPRNLAGLQAVLLLMLWMLTSPYKTPANDLWHLARYAMSVAIELGLHRHNPAWHFSAEELEIRNRTWWCTYALERQIATNTGRVLSIRDHAVQALMPVTMSFDALTESEARAAPIFHKKGVELLNHIIQLRRISGRILESVYIARGQDGQPSLTSFQELAVRFEEIKLELELWKKDISPDFEGTREYEELGVDWCLLVLLLCRPSPTFMIPSHQMVSLCSKIVSMAVQHWQKIDHECGISAVCKCFRQFHSMVIVALTALYCDW
jgi:hypothetical protein